MKLLFRAAAACALLPLLAGCISTEIASQTAPEFRDHRFQRTLVVADVGMLHQRTVAEDLIVGKLRDRRVDALRSLDVVFGADTLPEEAFLDHAAEAGADAVLILRVREEGAITDYSSPNANATFFATDSGGIVTGYSQTYGGGAVIRPWATFRATLIETATGRTAWFADASSDGTASSNQSDLVKAVAGKVAEQVLADGVLQAEQRL